MAMSEMIKNYLFEIDGAVVFAEGSYEIDDDDVRITLPPMNKEYKWGAVIDDIPFASKDRKTFVIAIAYQVGEECVTVSPGRIKGEI